MESPAFPALANLLQLETEDKDWFGMAEEAITTIYVLGDQPDQLCSELLRLLSKRVFNPQAPIIEAESTVAEGEVDGQAAAAEEETSQAQETQQAGDTTINSQATTSAPQGPSIMTNSFQLAQLIFTAGHIAIKHLVHLELIEKELKRRKETTTATSATAPKKTDELDQVAGSVEDDIADAMQDAKERELLYGTESLLAIFGPVTVEVCRYPKLYRVSFVPCL
jgi:condensin complex subunit 1